jgi:2-aminoethylphosphonate-pyruvate transaminase
LPLGGEPILSRALRLLAEHGVTRSVVVVGHLRDAYRRFADGRPGVELVDNPDYATTGTMASLARALERVDGDFLLLESDVVWERRALTALLAHPHEDVILASGPTRAGDEVWLEAPAGRLRDMSKDRSVLGSACGELVGVHRVSAGLAALLLRVFDELVAERGHARMAYDLDALVRASRRRPITVHVVPDLIWGEIDDERQYHRVRDEVLPEIARREGGERAAISPP